MKYLYAFLIGGFLCAIAQLLLDRTKLTPARILVIYVASGVILGFLGVYEPLVNLAGCGATTPLTGFGYLISKGIKEAIQENGIAGAITGGLSAASGGISAALLFSFVAALFFKSKPKR